MNKLRKAELIELINKQSSEIEGLIRDVNRKVSKPSMIKEYVVIDDKDTDHIKYLKKRLKYEKREDKKIPYILELKRLGAIE